MLRISSFTELNVDGASRRLTSIRTPSLELVKASILSTPYSVPRRIGLLLFLSPTEYRNSFLDIASILSVLSNAVLAATPVRYRQICHDLRCRCAGEAFECVRECTTRISARHALNDSCALHIARLLRPRRHWTLGQRDAYTLTSALALRLSAASNCHDPSSSSCCASSSHSSSSMFNTRQICMQR